MLFSDSLLTSVCLLSFCKHVQIDVCFLQVSAVKQLESASRMLQQMDDCVVASLLCVCVEDCCCQLSDSWQSCAPLHQVSIGDFGQLCLKFYFSSLTVHFIMSFHICYCHCHYLCLFHTHIYAAESLICSSSVDDQGSGDFGRQPVTLASVL